ncbi:MAG: toll/interleukin-1 receptor domain-containing protein [Planctomycetaceae bacterium]
MLFISHSTKDKDPALDLQARLRARGYASEQQFLDSDQRSGIRLGEKWEQAIYDNLRDCRALLVLCSPRWLESKWCFAELAAAKMAGKEVFPLVIEECDRSSLGEYQAAFLNQTDPALREQAFERLFQDLEARGLGPKEHLPWPHPDLKTADGQPDRCPFPGLLAFDERYAAVYFGREPETQVVLEELRTMRSQGEPRLLMIVGGSGSGKSSLLRAGVLPRLSHVTEAQHWLVLPTLRYGAAPSEEYTLFDQLARDLVGLFPPDARNIPDWKELRTRLGADDLDLAAQALRDVTLDLTSARNYADATVLLAFDQFEELLSAAASPSAAKFLKFLQGAFRQRNTRLLAVGSMRSDYLDLYERNPYALVAPAFKPWRLGPFPRERIPDIIEKPAARARLEISQELVKKLEQETPTAEALPLLAFTLEKLYRRSAADGKLELGEYHELGGMEGAIQKSVERVIPPGSLSPAVESALRLSFVKHLAQVNEKDEVVRRPARWTDLPAEAQPVLDQLVNERLLVKSEQDGAVRVEVAHEAMFRCWGDLKEWLRTAGDILRWRRDVERDRANDQQRWTGLREAQLAVARKWPNRRANELNEQEVGWIQDAIHRERLRRGIATGIMVVVACLAGLFWWQKVEADRATEKAVANEKEANNNLAEANFALGKVSFDKHDRDAAVLWWVKALETAEAEDLKTSLQNLVGAWSPRERRLAHDGHVECFALSRDGQTLLTGSNDHKARLWDVRGGVLRGKPLNHDSYVSRVAYSPDGATVVTACEWNNMAQLWDARTGALRGLLAQLNEVFAVAFSPDSKIVLTGGADNKVRMWETTTGTDSGKTIEHGATVTFITFSPDGHMLCTVSGIEKSELRLWDWPTCDPRGAPLVDVSKVYEVVFSRDGQTLITRSDDNSVRVIATNTGQQRISLQHSAPLLDADLSPDAQLIVTASVDKTARLWDARTGDTKGEPLTHGGEVKTAAFSPDGRLIVTASADKTARLWDVRTGEVTGEPMTHGTSVSEAAFSPDGQLVVTRSANTVSLWDIRTTLDDGRPLTRHDVNNSDEHSIDGQPVDRLRNEEITRLWDPQKGAKRGQRIKNNVQLAAVAYSPNAETVLEWATDEKVARLWDTCSGTMRGEPLTHPGYIQSVVFSPDGQIVLTGCVDGKARLWDTVTGLLRVDPLPHDGRVDVVAFSADTTAVLTGSRDNKARLWNSSTGSLIKVLQHSDPVVAGSFSQDGQIVVTASKQKLHIWNAVTGVGMREPLVHAFQITTTLFSPDGKVLVAMDITDGVYLWSVGSFELQCPKMKRVGSIETIAFSPKAQTLIIGTFGVDEGEAMVVSGRDGLLQGEPLQHMGGVEAITLSHDDSTVLTGSADKTARLWDVRTRVPLSKPFQHKDIVLAVSFSSDGQRLLTQSRDLQSRVWDSPTPAIQDRNHSNRLRLSVETRTGKRLTDNGVVQELTYEEWNSRRLELDTMGGPCDRPTWEEYHQWKRDLGVKHPVRR